MEHDRSSLSSQIDACSAISYNYVDNSIPSSSPMHTPSPTLSPFASPSSSPSDSNSIQKVSVEPPCQQTNKANTNTFVHKLFNMVMDVHYQHLIAWNHTGASFIVCNIVDFSRDVLPKHFKHNNFSSFVRQLNMYGFHKINKSPRGHRTLAENQIWEFSHQKFMRNCYGLLDEIKRKTTDTDSLRRDSNDITSHLSMMQFTQTDIMQQLRRLQDNFDQVIRELAETKQQQADQQEILKTLMQHLLQQQGTNSHTSPDFEMTKSTTDQPPSILITSPDVGNPTTLDNYYLLLQEQQKQTTTASSSSTHLMQTSTLSSQTAQQHIQHYYTHSKQNLRRSTPLTVQTQNLSSSSPMDMTFLHDGRTPTSPAHSAYYTPFSSTPVSPNAAFLTDDDSRTIYSPHSPHTPNTIASTSQGNQNGASMTHISTIQQQQQQQLQSIQLLPNDNISLPLDDDHALG
ncbi:HSF-type DNA-binding-domain-containing protein [Absidia repens]|uniref:HSF-type DNA-binding-domain-containing protein n=1 Tax=Absidia repens TaxID=90262 RepID=A0A1X2J241_9FUNG|nr:HSF-type DNA-binding-domain-containing protein [Absidia repens]